jgi:hypothetical protein
MAIAAHKADIRIGRNMIYFSEGEPPSAAWLSWAGSRVSNRIGCSLGGNPSRNRTWPQSWGEQLTAPPLGATLTVSDP